jgi:tetratricopeptide (TPR) repeat protein
MLAVYKTGTRLRIFISAVTSEFGDARDALAGDLRARDHEVTIQSDFQQNPDSETLLGALAKYIRDCHAVICIVGKRAGACPPPRAAEEFPKVLPADLKEASYTQWEFFFARHFKRRPYVYIAREDYTPDQSLPPSDRTALQDAFRDRLKAENVHYGPFSNIDQLARAVLKDLPDIAAKPAVPLRPTTKPVVLPYPSIGDLFKGRDEFMRRLHDSLTRARGGRTAIVSQALYGLGGIGKTRAAVEYAWAHADEYTALLFAVAESPEALRRNLAALAGALLPQLDTTDDAVRLAAVLDWLKSNPSWFLVLDNVDRKPALAEVERLLSGLAGGHVAVTGRLADFSANFQPLELEVLAVEDAAAFLLARTEGRRRAASDDAAKSREVAQELGQLALALEQAAAFIAKRRLTFAQYLEEWRSKRGAILGWSDPTVTGYPRSVAITWQTSVAQLSEGGRRLLERLAWLAPEKVPESLLNVPIPGAEKDKLRESYDDLAAYSLVTRDTEGPFFLVHRLVQDVMRRSLAGNAPQRGLSEALGWIDAAFVGQPNDVRNWPRLNPLVPHVRTVTAYADVEGIVQPTAQLMNQLVLLLERKALHAEAEGLIRRALAIEEKSFGPDHPNVARDLNNLAQLLISTNRFAEAERLMSRALAIVEGALGPDHPSVATGLNNLAQLLKDTNRLAEAEPLMRRALAIDEKNFGPDHPTVAIYLSNLASLLQDTNRLTEAEPLMRRALAIAEESFGQDHPAVATALNNLAILLQETNRLTDAEALVRRALTIDERSLGPDHPAVATRLSNLAGLLQSTNRLAEAEPLMRRALAIDERIFGLDHPTVATDLNNISQLLWKADRLAEAEQPMRRAVTIVVEFTRRTGHQHPHLDDAFTSYAALLAAMGKSQKEIKVACLKLARPLSGNSSS